MALTAEPRTWVLVANVIMLLATLAQTHETQGRKTHKLSWIVETTIVTRNCESVNITTVNGQYPGPKVEINEGDTVVIKVTNMANYNVSIHWHGIFQFLTNWADGPAHITQCPLPIGDSQTYEFTVAGQSGTFWWHAHNNWLRATVYGAFIVHPAKTPPYGEVAGEFSLLSGDWFSIDPNLIELTVINAHGPPNDKPSALTINGQPGPLYGCAPKRIQKFEVASGSSYLLRLTNSGLNSFHFFQVANHTVTVVAADGNYLKPFITDVVVITPGQTTDVLLTANQSSGSYYCGVSLAEEPGVPGSSSSLAPALAVIEYKNSGNASEAGNMSIKTPIFPMSMDSVPVNAYISKLKGLAPYDLPATMDHELVYTVGISSVACLPEEAPNCTVTKIAGTVQNLTFESPKRTTILEAFYYNKSANVFSTDFPDHPEVDEDFTSAMNLHYVVGNRATRVRELEFNATVQLVLQNVWALAPAIDHPFHLHGHDFYVVGHNYSNFNPDVHSRYFNLVDPPKFNTLALPPSGWVALRFRANNPGVWFLHCHFERHNSVGMQMVFITKNGVGSKETLPGPKHPIVSCT